MPDNSVVVLVDGREVVLPVEGLVGRAVLAAVGADPANRDVLIRDDEGRARMVAPDEPIELDDVAIATFRVHRAGGLFHLKVDGVTWEWGSPGIRESEIRDIVDLPEERALFLARGGGDPIRPGALIDLSADWVPSIVTRELPPERAMVPVVVNGQTREVAARDVSFEDLVGLAFPGRGDLTKGMFTVTYRHGPADRPEGSLVPTQSIRATQGTVIHVTATDKS